MIQNAAVNPALALSLQGVGVTYKRRKGLFSVERFPALNDVSFTLHRGDSLAVVGRNGAGKSSLLRVLAGILVPDRGEIRNYGCQIALLSLQAGFDPYLSGRDNAILSGLFLGLPKAVVMDKMEDIITFARLRDFIDQPIRYYSTGMRARLAFSVAIYLDPDVLLLDEVLAVGDAEFRERSQDVMRSRLESDRTIVLVSHQTQAIKKLCNRAVWLENGETLAEGEVDDVLERYESYEWRDDHIRS